LSQQIGHFAADERNGLASNCGGDKDAIAAFAQVFAKYLPSICNDCELMASLDSVSIAILLGAVLVMAGILSSLLALRFGAPLLLVFLFIGSSMTSAPPIWWARWRWR
jgi:hypothetical protein